MKPYYEESGITIYHGDCREILPQLPKVDLVLTDPPYGIGKWNATGGQSLSADEAADAARWDVRPSDAVAIALRADAPIFIATDLLAAEGIVPEAAEEERLSLFRDFVNSLDGDESPRSDG